MLSHSSKPATNFPKPLKQITPQRKANSFVPPKQNTPQRKANSSVPPKQNTPQQKANSSVPPKQNTPQQKANSSVPPKQNTPQRKANSSVPNTPQQKANSSVPPKQNRPIARDVSNYVILFGRHVGGQGIWLEICAVVGCGMRSGRDKGISFYRLPAEITHQGERTRELTKKRRALWLARIHRADLKPTNHTRVCSKHFIGGKY